MLIKLIKSLLSTLIVVYIMFAFVSLKVNPLEWSYEGRFGYVFISFLSWLLIGARIEMDKEIDQA